MNLALIAIVFWLVALAAIWLFVVGGDERDEHDSYRGEIEPPYAPIESSRQENKHE